MTFGRSSDTASISEPSGQPPATPGALVVGGAHVSIGIARSLGRRGIPVWTLTDHPLPKFSRYVQRSLPWPGAHHPDGVAAILALVRRPELKGWVLLATGDDDMRLIAQNRALLASHFAVATESWDTVQWVYDKRLTYQRAASLGIACASSAQPSDIDAVRQMDCRFPVVLKPARRAGINEFTRAKAWKADDRDELLALYRRAAALVGKDGVIVQEWIAGGGDAQFSYAGLWHRGAAVASLVARRTRQYPIDFGRSSTFVETVAQEQVESLAHRFLKSLDYTGVVEIEFKYDGRDRQFKILDANGRFWTWIALGHLAGVDFPYLTWLQALGRKVSAGRAKPGVAWMHGSRDVVAAAQEMRRGTLTLADYLAGFRKPLTFASFAIDDPLPALVELPVLAARRLSQRRRERSRLRRPQDLGGGLSMRDELS